MTDRPILFSLPMVRALMAGTKTQTRRVVMSREDLDRSPWVKVRVPNGLHDWQVGLENFNSWHALKVRFMEGDRLWVRERFAACAKSENVSIKDATMALMVDGWQQYPDGHSYPGLDEYAPGAFDRIKWRPGIHMPRWASRLTLRVTDVRVQRLQEISDVDAIAEGIVHDPATFQPHCPFGVALAADDKIVGSTPQIAYKVLWQHINGDGSWRANPWVCAVTFAVERANIDLAAA